MFTVLLVALFTAGCAIAIPPPREALTEDARRAFALLIERWQQFSDLRTLAHIDVKRGGERDRLTGVLLAKAPGSMRFEALSPFGQPFLLVTIHDGRLTAYDATTNEAIVGPATAETAAGLLHLPLEPRDIVAVLGGLAAPPDDLRVARVVTADESGPSLMLIGRVHTQRVWMDFDTGVVQQLLITGGIAEARVTYRRDAANVLTGFDLSAGNEYITGSVRYQDPVIAQGIDDDRFRFEVPAGARVRSVR